MGFNLIGLVTMCLKLILLSSFRASVTRILSHTEEGNRLMTIFKKAKLPVPE